MLVFYAVPVSNFCATVRLLLGLKGVPFVEEAPPGGYGSPEYKARVPSGTVPAIREGDLVLSESGVIAEYLDERFPEPPFIPHSPPALRARTRWLARLHDTRVEPPLRALFPQMSPALRSDDVVEQGWALLGDRLAELAHAAGSGSRLTGEATTLADYVYPATLVLAERMGAELGRSLPLPEKLKPWWTALRAEPAVASELRSYLAAVDAWLDAKRAQA